jgi:ketosteroid isomerase-like protein
MKKSIFFSSLPVAVLLLISCNDTPKEANETASVGIETTKPDLAQIRSEIQEVEKAWAAAQNNKDLPALMALYADDAISMPDGEPSLNGKAAIQAKQEKDFAAPRNYATIAFETQDIYSDGNTVTEVGTSISKDADGKVVRTGKYMAVYEKRDGKYLCIREIYNEDK